MKYYSDLTKRIYNTVEELTKAEQKYELAQVAEKARIAKEEEAARKAAEEKKARLDELEAAKEHYNKLLRKCIEDGIIKSFWFNFN